MKHLRAVLLSSLVASAFSTPALAENASLSGNLYLVSDYIFRGLDQTWEQPALQGGVDYSHPSGFYAGLWGSNVTGNMYPGGSSLELDYYFGYNGALPNDFGWTVGFYGYWYPGSNFNKTPWGGPDQTPNNQELNAGLSWKWLSFKLSYALSDYFGANEKTGYGGGTNGTIYYDLTANVPLENDWSVAAHVGHTDYKNSLADGTNPDYTDWSLGVTKGWQGWNFGLKYTYADNDFYKNVMSLTSNSVKDLGGSHWLVSVGRSF